MQGIPSLGNGDSWRRFRLDKHAGGRVASKLLSVSDQISTRQSQEAAMHSLFEKNHVRFAAP